MSTITIKANKLIQRLENIESMQKVLIKECRQAKVELGRLLSPAPSGGKRGLSKLAKAEIRMKVRSQVKNLKTEAA